MIKLFEHNRIAYEALKKASGYVPENIEFFTYAKLMNLSEDEISELHPDYTVLDEFHRAGAEMWGQGVQKLLNAYPDTPVLGLSATNIRYLDNQRDMADEIFEGNIASEMTLGEAIVCGILNPPKYILSIYSYQKDLERYERRVKTAKNKAVRDAAERYLEGRWARHNFPKTHVRPTREVHRFLRQRRAYAGDDGGEQDVVWRY